MVTSTFRGQILGDFLSTPTTYLLGWSFIDDDANAYAGFLDKSNYLTSPYPTRIGISKPIRGKIKATFHFGFAKMTREYYPMRYKNPGHFIFYDLNFRYQINLINSKQSRFPRNYNHSMSFLNKMAIQCQPIAGLGYSERSQSAFSRALTLNFGLGGTIWLVQNRYGITLQSVAKFGIQKPLLHAGSNYIAHSVSFIYVRSNNTKYTRAKRIKIIKLRTRF